MLLEGNIGRLGDIVNSLYVNNVPPHYRGYLRQFNPVRRFTGNRDVTERDYNSNELKALMQAVYNREWEIKNLGNSRIPLVNALLKTYGNDNELKNLLGRGSINYVNYNPTYVPTGRYNNGIPEYVPHTFNDMNSDEYRRFMNEYRSKYISDDMGNKYHNHNYKNPNLLMQGAIGAADYTIDNNGNVVLSDRYDWTQDRPGDNAHYSPLALFAKYAQKFKIAKPYNTRINLGNINDWDFGYTGNMAFDEARYRIKNNDYKIHNEDNKR